MSLRNTTGVKVALDSKAARFNVKKNELEHNRQRSHLYQQNVKPKKANSCIPHSKNTVNPNS